MATKTKTGVGTVLFVAVALVVGAGFLYGLVKRAPSDERSGVVFTVTFEPAKRVLPVDIVILVNGLPVKTDKMRETPWKAIVQIKRGQTATLIATQESSSRLSCAVNGEVQESRILPGKVVCTHKRA